MKTTLIFKQKLNYSISLIIANCKDSSLKLNKHFNFVPFANVKYFWY